MSKREEKGPLNGRVALSARLEAIADLAGRGRVVCDVGCDHAHIPIRLLQTGAYVRAIGMDVIEGPLGKAAGNLALYGMADLVELRLSDGLDAYRAGEADTLVVTGMGGTMMENILLREPDKTCSFSALVLGPQSDPDKVRAALRQLGFVITDERLIYEDGKYYPVLRAEAGDKIYICLQETLDSGREPVFLPFFPEPDPEKGKEDCGKSVCEKKSLGQEAEDLFGPVLLARQDPVLLEFLTRQTAVLEKILRSVSAAARQRTEEAEAGSDHEEDHAGKRLKQEVLRQRHFVRQKEIEHSLQVFRTGLAFFENNTGNGMK